MVALVFLLVIAVVFASILALEGGDEHLERRPAGLLTWIASGNWPAKIGGGLMIVGVGALLRYAAINFDVPRSLKLAVGIGATILLAAGSQWLAGNPRRRAISLALGGAAFGVAYLTAYSAYALLDYRPTLQGLGLLALTAVGAGVFAVTRSAMSLAVLSMVGAFIAPAFAVQDPGPQVVYGYYVAISLLTFGMVALRGWRPLIHLSFLFTLAGGAFFAWTADYFSRANAPQLLPLIAMLVAVHVAMPLFERRWQRGVVVESLDTLYLLAVPIAAAFTAFAIAPSRIALAHELWWFAGIWLAAAAWLYSGKREGMATHAVIALLMAGLGLAARFRNLPWELVALSVGVCALVLSARRSTSTRLHNFLVGLVLVLAAVHMAGALAPSASDRLFLNGRFFERLAGAGLLIIAALAARRLRHTLDSLMLTVAIGWSAFTVGAEVARLDLVSAWLLLHWSLALLAFVICLLARRYPAGARFCVPLVIALGLSAVLAGFGTADTLAWVSALIAAAAMAAIAFRPTAEEGDPESGRLLAALGIPIVVALWMARYAAGARFGDLLVQWQYPLAFAAAAAILVLLAAERSGERSRHWFNEVADIFAVGFVVTLAVATLFDIERVLAAALLELLCVAGLLLIVAWDNRRISIGAWLLPVTVIGIALLLQANLLRWLGPDGELNALSVTKMQWPTLVSLLWASIGAALTIAARRAGSRLQWTAGAAFLVGAAIKLVLLDFGSLGELANILAVMAAGGVFLLVGWLAPMPPARETPVRTAAQVLAPHPESTRSPTPPSAAPVAGAPGGGLEMPESYWHAQSKPPARRQRESNDRLAWAIAIAVFVLFVFSRCSPMFHQLRSSAYGHHSSTFTDPAAAEAVPPAENPPDSMVEATPPPVEAPIDAPSEPGPAPVQAANACEAWARMLPPNYKVYAVNSFDAQDPLPFRGVVIDQPGTNVVLILGATGATHWRFSVLPGSSLAGVWVTGRQPVQLENLPANVVLLDAAHVTDDCAAAGSSDGINPANEAILAVLRQVPEMTFQSADQWTQVRSGRTPFSAQRAVQTPDSSRRGQDTEAALRGLLERGAIRRMSMQDVDYWRATHSANLRFAARTDMFAPRTDEPQLRVFMVQQAMEFPEGLTGAHMATFIVPPGVPSPTGDRGHSQVIDLNQ